MCMCEEVKVGGLQWATVCSSVSRLLLRLRGVLIQVVLNSVLIYCRGRRICGYYRFSHCCGVCCPTGQGEEREGDRDVALR